MSDSKSYLFISLLSLAFLFNCSNSKTLTDPTPTASKIQFHLATDQITEKSRVMKMRGSEREIGLNPEVLLETSHISNVTEVKETGSPKHFVFGLELTSEGSHLLQEITKSNRNKRLAIVINDQLLVAPVITGEINNGKIPVILEEPRESVYAIYKKIKAQVNPPTTN